MSTLTMGIDIGTGSAKGVLTTTDGEILSTEQVRLQMQMPRAGHAEMDAEQDWWGSVSAIARRLMEHVGDHELAGLCVSGLGPALVVCQDDLTPIHPAVLYGIDSRASVEIEEQTEALGAEKILERCGKHLSSQAVGPKLAWVAKHVPAYQPSMKWFSSHSYVVARLTDRWVLDHHTASQCDPLYDVRAQDWARDWAEQVLPGLPLPELVWPSEVVGTVTAQAARATGLPEGLPVVAGTIDAWAEAFGVGVCRPGDLMLMYGSTLFMIQVLPAPAVDRRLWTTSGIVPGSHTLAAGMSTSGSLTQWVQELTGGAPFEELVEEASQVPAGSDGLVVLPYFAGERSPHYDPRARGLIAGLTLRHKRGHLFRAAYEGIAYGVRDVLNALAEVAGPPLRIVAVGGGTKGGLWTQVVSDVCGVEQVVPKVTIGASYGDALMAAIGTGLVKPTTTWAEPDRVVEPRTETSVVYDQLYRVFRRLYPATAKQVHHLADIQIGDES